MDAPLRGGRRGGSGRPSARQGVGQAGSERPGGGSGAALSRALSGLHGEALPRASGEGSRLRLGLHLDEAAPSVEGRGRQGAAQGRASAQARAACVAGMLHQDGSRHAWLAGAPALDLIVTLDDATGAIYSAFLVEEEGTASTFQALKEAFGADGPQ